MARQDYTIEIRQQPVVSCQPAGRQLGRCLHLAHKLGGGFSDGDRSVQGGVPVFISYILSPVPHCAGVQSKAEALAVQLHRKEALFRFRLHNESLMLEVEG